MTTLEEELDRRLYCLKQFAKTATSLIQVRLEVWRCTNSMLTKCLRAWTSKNSGKDVGAATQAALFYVSQVKRAQRSRSWLSGHA